MAINDVFLFSECMHCLIRYDFVIITSAICQLPNKYMGILLHPFTKSYSSDTDNIAPYENTKSD